MIFFSTPGSAQWLDGYDRRKELVISDSKVSGGNDLQNFPLLVSLTEDDLRSTTYGGYVENDNGYDIAFTSENGETVLNHELDFYADTSGHVVAWVSLPTFSASENTTIYIYWGNDAIIEDPSSIAVFGDADYDGVYHFSEISEIRGSAPAPNNSARSTGYRFEETSVNSDTLGKIGMADKFDGGDGYRYSSSGPIVGNASFVFSAWVYLHYTDVAQNQHFPIYSASNPDDCCEQSLKLAIGTWGGLDSYLMAYSGNGDADLDTAQSASQIPLLEWVHIAFAFQRGASTSTDSLKFYINGELDAKMPFERASAPPDGGGGRNDRLLADGPEYWIGRWASTSRGFDGYLDEVRMAANSTPSEDWLASEVTNVEEMTEGTFFETVGDTETNATLPVELVHFEGRRSREGVLLKWSTATEVDNDFFVVERSYSGDDFLPIAKLAGQGDSHTISNYSFFDKDPLNGYGFYRLKQTDFDGTFTYSNIIMVQDGVARTPELSIFPNANNGVDFTWSLNGLVPNSEVAITLLDMEGKEIRSQQLQLDGSGAYQGSGFENMVLPAGIYLLRVTNEGEEMTSRLLVR